MTSEANEKGGDGGPPRLAGGSVVAFFALVFNGLSRILASVSIGRFAGPGALGVFQTGLAASQIATLFGPSVFGSAASAFLARAASEDRALAEAVRRHILLRVLQSGLLVVVTSSLVWSLSPHSTRSSTAAFAFLTLAFCLYLFTRGVLYGTGNGIKAAVLNIIASTLGTLAVALTAVASNNPSLHLAVFATGYIFFGFLSWPGGRPRRLDTALGKEIDRFAVFGIIGTLASGGFLSTSMIVASATAGSQEAGRFAAAFALAVPSSLLGSAVSLVLFPKLARLRENNTFDQRRYMVDLSTRLFAVPVVVFFAGLLLLRSQIVDIVWGESFEGTADVLALLLLALMFSTLAVPTVVALTATNNDGMRKSAVASILGLGLGITVWIALIPSLGLAGVTLGFLAGTILSSANHFVLTWRITGQAWAKFAAKILAVVSVLAVTSLGQEFYQLRTAETAALLTLFVIGWSLMNISELRTAFHVAKSYWPH